MTTDQTRSRRIKRLLAIGATAAVAAAGTFGLALSEGSDDTPAAKPVPTAGTHKPSLPPPGAEHGAPRRYDGGPEEGSRGPGRGYYPSPCIDPDGRGHGPGHC